ncbi:MAG: hypothetical protein E7317_08740 [Clostridiales bacterium]|nr:hypothetical protein [Clostridiales bacterium]
MRQLTVNVRALAEFSLLKGDIVQGAGLFDRLNDGSLGHRQLQAALEAGWNAEEAVRWTEVVDDTAVTVQGRADAVSRAGGRLRVLEIKTVSVHPSVMTLDDHPAHIAQGQLYAYGICVNEGYREAEVELCYYRLDGARKRFRRTFSVAELREVFLKLARPYVAWYADVEALREASLPTMRALAFPFPNYREGQRDMAAAVYRAMCDGTNALIEAPTGIGKTAAALFGALKAVGRGKAAPLFYLTARTTGRRAAVQALDRMRASGLRLRSIVITAKEKCCLLGTKECFGCPYASDYYARRRDALREALTMDAFDQDTIEALAREYELCPYELSLDISEEADVIICDYNYVFDPRVRLKRYFDQKSDAGLLIDEAHNLPDRAVDMLSAELSGKRVERIRRQTVRTEGKDSPASVALAELLRLLSGEMTEPESLEEVPQALTEGVRRFADTMSELPLSDREQTELMLDAIWFCRLADKWDPEHYRVLKQPEDKRFSIRLWCFDPSEHIRRALDRVKGAGLFSATLAPMDFFARRLGLKEADGDSLVRLHSPFPQENLMVMQLSVDVTFNQRAMTMHKVIAIIRAMVMAHTGNYIACFPSYQYMNEAYEQYRAMWPDEQVVRQSAGMGEADRLAFIDLFREKPGRSLLAFIVLGGIFSEGVDLPDDRLSGAAIVSNGMPVPTFERTQLAELLDDGFGSGMEEAYLYPGMRRVLQAAGRVIRTETDKGVVFLIDKRYRATQVRALMPEHWNVEHASNIVALKERLCVFWNGN